MQNSNIADLIKASVKMGDVIDKYGFKVGKNKRIPCPFHGGVDNNLGYKDNFFHCFVCGAKGDIITFVQKYYKISFAEALEKLCLDFSLPYGRGEALTRRDAERIGRSAFEERKRRNEAINALKQAQDDYFVALGEVTRLEDLIKRHKPHPGDSELHPKYVEGITNIDYARHVLCEREEALRRLE